jgi:uncharacterized protein YjbJ (UPF0337 family)
MGGGQDGRSVEEAEAQVPAAVGGDAPPVPEESKARGLFKSFQGKFDDAKTRAKELGINDLPYVEEAQSKVKESYETSKEQVKKWADFGITHVGYAKDNTTEKFDQAMEQVVLPVKEAKDAVNKLVRVEPEWMAVGLGVTLALMATRKGPRRMVRNGLLGTGAGIGGLYALSASEGGK